MRPPKRSRKLKEVNQAIKDVRYRLRETQQRFANRLGLTLTAVARFEIGERTPCFESLVRLERVANYCGLTEARRVFQEAQRMLLGKFTIDGRWERLDD